MVEGGERGRSDGEWGEDSKGKVTENGGRTAGERGRRMVGGRREWGRGRRRTGEKREEDGR